MRPFQQLGIGTKPAPGGFHVERAGEIVAAALALQLDRMGYLVGLNDLAANVRAEPSEAVGPPAGALRRTITLRSIGRGSSGVEP